MRASRSTVAAGLGLAGFVLAACQPGGAPPQRGFGSRLLVNTRDPTLSLIGYAADGTVFYTTGGMPGGDPRTFWSVDSVSGRLQNLGAKLPDPPPPDPSVHTLDCKVDLTDSGQTLVITDSMTKTETSIDRLQAMSRCPTVADPFLAALRTDDAGLTRLWSGPYDQLQPAPVDLVVDQLIDGGTGSDPDGRVVTLLAEPAADPMSRGILRIDLATFAVTTVIPPVLAEGAWTAGATPAGPLESSGLTAAPVLPAVGSASQRVYAYHRKMSDGGDTLFIGPAPAGGSTELALYRVPTTIQAVPIVTTSGMGVVLSAWQAAVDAFSDQMVLWDPTGARITTCSVPRTTRLDATLLTDNVHIAMVQTGTADVLVEPNATGPLLLVSRGPAGGCQLLAGSGVGAVAFSPTQLLWMAVPMPYDRTLWVAGLDGSNPRAIGSGYLDEPHFLSDTEIEMEMGGDLVWVDTHEEPVQVHYVVEQVYGAIWDSARWVITGWDYTAQDGTGTMGLVARDTGQKRAISPAVSTFMLFWTDSALTVAYVVRGRNPSDQDGVWAATISVDDLQ